MRNIYKLLDKNSRVEMQQGAIITGCIAENYSCEIFGIIITPRCDIGNGGKVSTLHYLPIVSLENWLKTDCLRKCKQSVLDDLQRKMHRMLEEQKISVSIIEWFPEEKVRELTNKVKNKVQFMAFYSDYINIKNNTGNIPKSVIDKCSSEYDLLCKGRNNRFYIIESWVNKEEYYVILLRDIKRLEYSFANNLSKGLRGRNIAESELRSNDICENADNFEYKTVACLDSPYIEHIIQSFSHNFCRIGVDGLSLDEIKRNCEINKIIW